MGLWGCLSDAQPKNPKINLYYENNISLMYIEKRPFILSGLHTTDVCWITYFSERITLVKGSLRKSCIFEKIYVGISNNLCETPKYPKYDIDSLENEDLC